MCINSFVNSDHWFIVVRCNTFCFRNRGDVKAISLRSDRWISPSKPATNQSPWWYTYAAASATFVLSRKYFYLRSWQTAAENRGIHHFTLASTINIRKNTRHRENEQDLFMSSVTIMRADRVSKNGAGYAALFANLSGNTSMDFRKFRYVISWYCCFVFWINSDRGNRRLWVYDLRYCKWYLWTRCGLSFVRIWIFCLLFRVLFLRVYWQLDVVFMTSWELERIGR